MIVARKEQQYNRYESQGNLARQAEPLYYPEKDKKAVRKLNYHAPVILTLSFVVITAVVLVTMSVINFSVQNQINQMKNELTALETENETLQGELASLSSIDRLENIALSRLGLIYPQDNQQIIISRSR